MSKKRVLVCGAAGFIGTYLCDSLLEHGFEILAADLNEIGKAYYESQGIRFFQLDITQAQDLAQLDTAGLDAVINLACVQPANVSKEKYNPIDYIRVNVIGTLNLLEYCRKAHIPKMITAMSHRNTKGLWQPGKKIREDEGRAIELSGEYAMFSISESTAEDCVSHYSHQYGIQGIIFRLSPVYGYGPHTHIYKNGVAITTGFQHFIDHAIAGTPLEIWGDPHVGRDIIYVKDVVKAYLLALDHPHAQGLFNICSGHALSLKEQAEETIRVFRNPDQKNEIIYRPEMPNSIEPFLYDYAKAQQELGWQPSYSFYDLLIDYKKEMESRRFQYLVEKRKQMLKQS